MKTEKGCAGGINSLYVVVRNGGEPPFSTIPFPSSSPSEDEVYEMTQTLWIVLVNLSLLGAEITDSV